MAELVTVTDNECCATQGKFRAVVMIDSDMYRIDDDVNTPQYAFALCRLHGKGHPVQVYNDCGDRMLKDGKLIK